MQPFTEDYKDQVFYLWYENGKIVNFSLMGAIPVSPNGRKPSEGTIKEWVGQGDWNTRADGLDGQITRVLDNSVIEKRVTMYKRHAEIGRDMVEMGMAYLKENGLKREESAIRAIAEGIDIQRQSIGLAEALQKISTMDNDQLTKELQKLLGKPQMGENDVTVTPEEVE